MVEESELGFPVEEVQFIGEEYKGAKGGYTFKDIIMAQVSRITRLASREFRGGYWETKFDAKGNETRKYIPDSRMEYANAINILLDILEPYVEDKKILEEIDKIEKDFKEKIKKLTDEDGIFAKDQESVILHSYESMKSRRLILRQLVKYLKSVDYFKSGEVISEE